MKGTKWRCSEMKIKEMTTNKDKRQKATGITFLDSGGVTAMVE